MKKVAPVLKYHGGKNYLADKIVARMPAHLTYLEPYAGGLACLLARDPLDPRLFWPGHTGVSEVVNDLNKDLTRFWQVLRDPELFARFHRAVVMTPFSEQEFRDAVMAPQLWHGEDEQAVAYGTDPADRMVALAWCFFIRCRMSLAGRMRSFTGITKTRTRRGMSNEVSAWLSAVEGLPDVHERLKRVLVLNRDALEVIRDYSREDALIYCDPPYLQSTRTAPDVYAHEMSEAQHRELLQVLCKSKARVMLSGYRSVLYDEMLEGWRREDFDLPNNAAGNPVGEGGRKKRMTESLWCNFPAPR